MATTQTACRVCAGHLSLRVAGTNGHTPLAEACAPSRHETGRHGDLLACVECGTVQQPLLPAGDELHDLYRDMSDDAYLGEEPGRRATAAHLLDLIGAQVAAGRLLDADRSPGAVLPICDGRAAVFQSRAGPASIKRKLVSDLDQAG